MSPRLDNKPLGIIPPLFSDHMGFDNLYLFAMIISMQLIGINCRCNADKTKRN